MSSGSWPTPQEIHVRRHVQARRVPSNVTIETCLHCARERATCERKSERYIDANRAELAAREHNMETNWAKPVQPYRCPWCGWWHMATVLSRQRRRLAMRQERKARRERIGRAARTT